MLDLSQKLPLARSLNRIAEQKAANAIQLLGKALPAQVTAVMGSIVTVKFLIQSTTFTLQQVTIPVGMPEYIRLPVQVDDLGVVFPADVFLGGVTGLGSGVASLTLPANLSSLVFFPVGNKNFSTTDDPNKLVLYGPDGVVVRTLDKSLSMVMDQATGLITFTGAVEFKGLVTMDNNLQLGGNVVSKVGAVYAGNFATAGTITAGSGTGDSVTLTHHTHPANGSPPTPGT